MFEAKGKPLLPRPSYYARLARSAAIGLLVIVIALGAGMFGYHHFEGMPWIDAFANAAMILSGMGPLATLTTAKGKLRRFLRPFQRPGIHHRDGHRVRAGGAPLHALVPS